MSQHHIPSLALAPVPKAASICEHPVNLKIHNLKVDNYVEGNAEDIAWGTVSWIAMGLYWRGKGGARTLQEFLQENTKTKTNWVVKHWKSHLKQTDISSLWIEHFSLYVCLGAQSCPTLCDPMDCSPQAPLSMEFSRNSGVGCHALLQEIFPTQGWNPGLLHCRWILYHLSHWRSPFFVWEDARLWAHWNHPFDMHHNNLSCFLHPEPPQGAQSAAAAVADGCNVLCLICL